jgi:hypothetical protein
LPGLNTKASEKSEAFLFVRLPARMLSGTVRCRSAHGKSSLRPRGHQG